MRCNLVPPHTQTLASCSPHCPQFQEGERPACSHLFCPSFGGNLATSLLISTTWHCWLWLRRGGQGRSWESYFGTGKRAVMVNCGQIRETMTGSVGLGTLLRAFFPHASLPVVRSHTEDGKAEGLWEVEETHQKKAGWGQQTSPQGPWEEMAKR